MNKKQIGELIKQEREGRNLLQRDLADAANVRRQAILEMENADYSYGIDRLIEVLDALDLRLKIVPKKNVFNFKTIKSPKKK